jgi:hypothetical protein
MTALFVACGDGSAALVHTDLTTYTRVFDHAQHADTGCDYLIASGQVIATGVRVKRTELFDGTHWLATREMRSVGFAHTIEVTRAFTK